MTSAWILPSLSGRRAGFSYSWSCPLVAVVEFFSKLGGVGSAEAGPTDVTSTPSSLRVCGEFWSKMELSRSAPELFSETVLRLFCGQRSLVRLLNGLDYTTITEEGFAKAVRRDHCS